MRDRQRASHCEKKLEKIEKRLQGGSLTKKNAGGAVELESAYQIVKERLRASEAGYQALVRVYLV